MTSLKSLCLLLSLSGLMAFTPASAAAAAGGQVLQVNIFGDDDPLNGVEDNRIGMDSPLWNKRANRPWNMGAGTIHCDGQNRGSAAIVDTSEWGGDPDGLVIATSAHVLFDLESGRRFESCQFHYMALDHLPGYQAPVSSRHLRMGSFDPARDRTHPAFGRGDWAFLYVDGPIPGIATAGRFRLWPFADLAAVQPGEVGFSFIAFSPSSGSMAISTPCRVIESKPDDLGGGAWPGQLLDDCDSEGGASGGALVASVRGEHFLVGIRSGSHWDGRLFPPEDYPDGPPDGASWDIRGNTNFSRAIDRELLVALKSLIEEVAPPGALSTI